jgi:peptide/nickel transport system substrate-binding protein
LKETRQAILQCIDRQALTTHLGLSQEQARDAYLPATQPVYDTELVKPSFDPQTAGTALEAAGWLDADNELSTPRVSQGVAGVPDGTPFTVELATLQEDQRQAAAGVVKDSLAGCRTEVNLRSLPQEERFCPGPEGRIFGRRFQMALFGWDSSLEPACQLFTTSEIPGPYPDHPKGWGGANAGGFTNAQFDAACRQAHSSLPDDPNYTAAHHLTQMIFAEESPSIPLYSHSRWLVTRPDLCGLQLDSSTQEVLWDLEALNYGDGCSGD